MTTEPTTPISDAELAAIEQRAAAATAGPWYAHNPDDSMFMNVLLVSDSPDEPLMGEPPFDDIEYGKVIALTLFQAPRVVCHDSDKWDENTAFIAAAREDVPRLVGECRRLQAVTVEQAKSNCYYQVEIDKYRSLYHSVIANPPPGHELQARIAILEKERHDAIKQSRTICEELDLPNDWPDDLHLADVIEKRIGNYMIGDTE